MELSYIDTEHINTLDYASKNRNVYTVCDTDTVDDLEKENANPETDIDFSINKKLDFTKLSKNLTAPTVHFTLSFNKVTQIFKKKKILNGVSGAFYPGQLVALMGPSGAGKSSLLNILSGYKPSHTSGEINVNGVKRNLNDFKKVSAYIMQDDILLTNFTIKESMMFSANLRMSEKTPRQKENMVNVILKALGLFSCLNTYITKLSGGQRKRLCIALELIANPAIIFLDEPTSGLDSQSALVCVSILRNLASQGRIVVCTIHQPSSKIFNMFDRLYLIAAGQTIYDGPTSLILNYFSHLNLFCPKYHNIADYVIEVASGEINIKVDQLISAWSQRKQHENGSNTYNFYAKFNEETLRNNSYTSRTQLVSDTDSDVNC